MGAITRYLNSKGRVEHGEGIKKALSEQPVCFEKNAFKTALELRQDKLKVLRSIKLTLLGIVERQQEIKQRQLDNEAALAAIERKFELLK